MNRAMWNTVFNLFLNSGAYISGSVSVYSCVGILSLTALHQSIAVEIGFDAVYTAYLMWIVGPSTQFDAIAVSLWGSCF